MSKKSNLKEFNTKEYIKDHGTVTEETLMRKIEEYQSDSTLAYAVWSDKFGCTSRFDGDDIARLQEVRIFNEQFELRARRKGDQFLWRVIDDEHFKARLAEEKDKFMRDINHRIYQECHYLDIAENTGTNYTATGGGTYSMPRAGLECIILNNYLDYDKLGIVQIADFRLVRFTEKGE